MAESFNPYHVWLGIPPEEQPANHYRLLSIRLFETNADVIDHAADRQMAHLRTLQVGKHAEQSQRLLNELATARVCLLDPKKREDYDRQLRAKLAAAMPTAPASVVIGPGGATAAGAASAASAGALPASGSAIVRQPPLRGASAAWGRGNPATAAAARRQATNRKLSYGIAAAAVLVAAIAIGMFAMSRPAAPATGTLVFDWPPAERQGAELTVDGQTQKIALGTDKNPFDLTVPPGRHTLHLTRAGFAPFSQSVELAAGTDRTIKPSWTPVRAVAINSPDPAGIIKSLDPAGAIKSPEPAGAITFPLNEWVDVLRLADISRDVVSGEWSRDGQELRTVRRGIARLMLPVAVDGSYDLDVAFARLNGAGEIRIRLPVGPSACDAEWGMGGTNNGLDSLDWRHVEDDANPTKVFTKELANGRVYRLGIQVRMLPAGAASIDATLDGKSFLPRWEGAHPRSR